MARGSLSQKREFEFRRNKVNTVLIKQVQDTMNREKSKNKKEHLEIIYMFM